MTDLAFSDFVEDDDPTDALVPVDARRSMMPMSPNGVMDFQLRANGKNKLLDLSMSLLGLAVRIRDMPNYSDIGALHARVTNELQNFQQEAEALGYDDAAILAARYCICATIDEAVLSQTWGAESMWPERPMLSIFHNETWGGEKVFGILDRVMDEAHRFPDLLEFIYFCLALGFEGKYHVMHDGQVKLDHLMQAIFRVLEKQQGEAPLKLVDPTPNIYQRKQRTGWRIPVWSLPVLALAVLGASLFFFDRNLNDEIAVIAEQIDSSLNSETGQD